MLRSVRVRQAREFTLRLNIVVVPLILVGCASAPVATSPAMPPAPAAPRVDVRFCPPRLARVGIAGIVPGETTWQEVEALLGKVKYTDEGHGVLAGCFLASEKLAGPEYGLSIGIDGARVSSVAYGLASDLDVMPERCARTSALNSKLLLSNGLALGMTQDDVRATMGRGEERANGHYVEKLGPPADMFRCEWKYMIGPGERRGALGGQWITGEVLVDVAYREGRAAVIFSGYFEEYAQE